MLQGPVIAGTPQPISARIGDLRAKAGDLKLRASDLEVRKNQLGEQRQRARRRRGSIVARQAAGRRRAQARGGAHPARGDERADRRPRDRARHVARVHASAAAPAPADPFLGPEQITMSRWAASSSCFRSCSCWRAGSGSAALGARCSISRTARGLQRIEQAVESIAVEVERIGEAQRFTTKLLADRQPDAAARIGVVAASRARHDHSALTADRARWCGRARLPDSTSGREETAHAAASELPQPPQPRNPRSSRGPRGSRRSRRWPARAATSR